MSNNKQSSVDLLQAIELQRDLNLADYKQAKAIEIAGNEISYAEGYAEGYKRALGLIQWNIENQLKKLNKVTNENFYNYHRNRTHGPKFSAPRSAAVCCTNRQPAGKLGEGNETGV